MTFLPALRAPADGRIAALVAATVLLVAVDVAALVRRPLALGRAEGADWMLLVVLAWGVAFTLVGGVALGRRPRAPGWLLAGGLALLAAPAARTLIPGPIAGLLVVLGVAALLPLGLTRVPRRGPMVRVLAGLDTAIVLGGSVAGAGVAAGRPGITAFGGVVALVALFSSGWMHFELSAGDERRRVLWLVLGTGGVFLGVAVVVLAPVGDGTGAVAVQAVAGLLAMLLPAATAVALLDPRRFDVRAVVHQVVIVSAMLSLVVAVFSGIAASYRLVAGELPGLGVLGILAAVVAAGYHPVLVRVRDATDELLFGGRADPVDTLTRLGSELSAGSSPGEWLRALRLALAVPAAELRSAGRTVARSGDDPGRGSESLPLRLGPEQVGELVVALPAEQLRLPATTRAVLDLVAGPLAQALHATALAAQLQSRRERVVAALEEERRRMRRDLHDGLGPTLTGIAYSIDAATNLVATDPVASAALLRQLRQDTADAIAEIRRIVYGLRPRAIDELGLVDAVRQQVARLRTADGRPLTVHVEAPVALPDLPAAVEVVAYRTAVEAVTNVARHAGVDEATLRFAVTDAFLDVEVRDAGGAGPEWTPGVGLTGMRERVEEVGGSLRHESGPGLSRVQARIPLPPGAPGGQRTSPST